MSDITNIRKEIIILNHIPNTILRRPINIKVTLASGIYEGHCNLKKLKRADFE
jgi:hypothetical protein